MSNLSDIKRRLESVKQTRQITSAMQTVSVAKMRRAIMNCDNSRAYIDFVTNAMRSVAASCEKLEPPRTGKDIRLVLSTDKGLCGGFDSDIIKKVTAEIGDKEDVIIMPIGSAATDRFKSDKRADLRFSDCYSSEYGVVKAIAEELLGMYGHGVKSVGIAYARYSARSRAATLAEILPVGLPVDTGAAAAYCEPSAEDLYSSLLPLYTACMIYDAMQNNFAAEHSARHEAMSAATESADSMIVALSLEYNRARQSAVTEQIIEISGATTALKNSAQSDVTVNRSGS